MVKYSILAGAEKVPYLLYPDTRQAGFVGRQVWMKFHTLLNIGAEKVPGAPVRRGKLSLTRGNFVIP